MSATDVARWQFGITTLNHYITMRHGILTRNQTSDSG